MYSAILNYFISHKIEITEFGGPYTMHRNPIIITVLIKLKWYKTWRNIHVKFFYPSTILYLWDCWKSHDRMFTSVIKWIKATFKLTIVWINVIKKFSLFKLFVKHDQIDWLMLKK
jgi:hypothetical protein